MSGPELALLVEGFDPARGGAERAVRSLVEAWAREGRAVAVYAPAERLGPPLPAPALQVGVELPRGPRARFAWAAAQRLNEAARAAGARRVIACGKLLGADLYWPHGGVHASTRAESLAGRSLWARVGRHLRPAEWAYDGIERRAVAECREGRSQVVALSGRVQSDFARVFGLDPDQIPLVPNGVEARFAPPSSEERGEARRALARRVGARGDAALALFCANAFRLKGLETLLRAAARAPGTHVVVAGADDPRPWLPLAFGLGLQGRLTFLGRVADLVPVYWGATVLVHPSRYDPCSLVVLEALAAGLPVIGSPADGSSERIGGAGVVLPSPDDVYALTQALEQAALPERRRLWAERASAFRRPWSAVGSELLDLLARRDP